VVFAATMLVRVPVFLFSGVAGSVLPNLARLNAAEERGRFVHTVTRVCVFFGAVTLALVAVTAVVGPTAMRLLFGPAYTAPASDLALLAVGAGFYLASATISQALLALARAWRGAAAWAVSAGVFVCVEALAPGDDLRRVSVGIAAAMVVNTGLLALIFALSRHEGEEA
jgi:O-antigen/teichoic acid export membrane protein